MNKKIFIPILTAFILVFAVSAGFIIKHYTESAKQEALYDSLAEIVETEPDENVEPAEPIQYTETKTILPEYTELFTQNSDMVGWITVENTKINYPVMQSKNEPNFYLKHGFDKAYTDYGCPYVQEYEVIAVFKTFVYSDSPDSFKYYHFVDAENEDEFNAYVEKCRELSLYDTGVSAEYGDKLISLSTCEYSRTNGRLVVVAKLVK